LKIIKSLKKKVVEVKGYLGPKDAIKIVELGMADYQKYLKEKKSDE